MSPTKVLRAVPFLALALYTSACKESTSPSAVDPTAMATSVDGINSTFSQNAVFQSLALLSSSFTLTAPVVRPSLPAAPTAAAWPEAEAEPLRLMRALAGRAPAAILALFPSNVLGKTFQWDTASGGKYRILDSTLTGAPAAGVRFILSQADSATGKPRLPLTTTGFVDLSDESTAQANVLHLVLHVGTQTAADYKITEVKTTTSLTLTAAGYVVDVVAGGAPANFTLTHMLTLADSSLVTDFQVTAEDATVSMHTTISGAGGTNVTLDWIVQKGGSIEVVGTSTPTAINVQFKFNGTTWATVNGDPNSPTITGANGRQLTPAELIALGEILRGFGQMALNLNAVFVPGYLVFK